MGEISEYHLTTPFSTRIWHPTSGIRLLLAESTWPRGRRTCTRLGCASKKKGHR